jgi:splicing factor 3B subunit 1
MNCPIVPRMTPILRNRHEKVQEASINLIGRIGEHSPLGTVAGNC